MFKIISEAVSEEEYKSKHKFFKERATVSYLQTFRNFVNNNENKWLLTCLKEKHGKRKYI